MIDLNQINQIHIVGIGGIGVSALAKFWLKQGKKITGSDLYLSPLIKELEKRGAKIIIGPHRKENLPSSTQLLVYSLAVPSDNPERKAATNKNIPQLSYPEAVGLITQDYKLITISGTHGKSTTSALLGHILEKTGYDPTIILGSKVKKWEGNFRKGKSKFFVLEACEYKNAFLNYSPYIAIITNIEKDHLDFFQTEENILKSFGKFINKIDPKGFVIINADDEKLIKIAHLKAKCSIVTFGIQKPADFQAVDLKFSPHSTHFTLLVRGLNEGEVSLKLAGSHNVANALAALACVITLGIKKEEVVKALKSFTGLWRRLEIKATIKNIVVIDDYAHHPTEIKATLRAVKQKFPSQKIWCIFQPHHYHRTYILKNEFIKSFNLADRVIITEIYGVAGRENSSLKEKISGEDLALGIKERGIKSIFISDFEEITKFVLNKIRPPAVILTLGAGDITKLSDELVKKLKYKK